MNDAPELLPVALEPSIYGTGWSDAGFHAKRWEDARWELIVKELAGRLFKVYAVDKSTGAVWEYARVDGDNSADGLMWAYGAAYRKWAGREHPTDRWYPGPHRSLIIWW